MALWQWAVAKVYTRNQHLVWDPKPVFQLQNSSRCSTATTSCLYMYTSCKIFKKAIEIPVSLFFLTLDLIWSKFCPNDHTHFIFLWLISNEICYLIQSILITYVAIQQFWKKSWQNLVKIVFRGPICTKRGHYGPRPQWFLFGKNNKCRSSAFIKISHV